jgi:long-subunit fatty acid transport protein
MGWVAACLLPVTAHAAGFEVPDNGTVALGRGGQFTAVANDGTALQYNPAGLAGLEGLNLTLDVNRVAHTVTYHRLNNQGDDEKVGTKTISNVAAPFNAPFAALTFGRALPNHLGSFAVAAGAYGPSSTEYYTFARPDPTGDPAADAPQRYQLIQNDLFIVYPTLALAYTLPFEKVKVSIGATVQAVYSHFIFDQDIYAQPSQKTAFGTDPGTDGIPESQKGVAGGFNTRCTGTGAQQTCTRNYSQHPPTSLGSEDPGWDGEVKVDMKGKLRPATTLAVLAQWEVVRLGLSFRPGYSIHADGTMDVTLPSVLTDPNAGVPVNAKVSGNAASLDLKWPNVLRAGVDVAIPPVPGKLDVGLDWTYEGWSAVDEFVLTPNNIKVTSSASPDQTLAAVHIPKHLKDAMSVRVGAGYELPLEKVNKDLRVQVRTGGFFEQSALPAEYTTVDLAHFQRFGISGGASVGYAFTDLFGPFWLDLAAMYSPTVTRDVRTGAVPLTTSDPYLAHGTVNDGDYTSSMLILSLGIRTTFNL